MKIVTSHISQRKAALFFLIFTVFSSVITYCQTVKGWEVVPPSPDAAALGKYGNTPVGMYTGIPEINIPLYTIKTKKLELPISMSYHASGFNVNELAPWSGLGWTLSAGGAVSRSAVGLGDDISAGYLYDNSSQFATEIDQNDLQWLMLVTNGQADNESDFYFYNFVGRSGKFVFDDNRQPFLIPKEPIKVTFNSATNSFQIVGEDGTIYKFADREIITSGAYLPGGEDSQTYTGTYYLTQIVSADGTDDINLSYQIDGYYSETNTNYSETVGDKCVLGENGVAITGAQRDFNNSFNFRTVNNVLRLSEINFANGKVEFTRITGRLDGGNSRLSEIRIKKKNAGGTYDLQKTYRFDMGYFSSGAAARLKLNSIVELDASTNVINSHEFLYNESTLLPTRGSFGIDWWGYYNGKNFGGSSLVPKEIIKHGNHTYHVGDADRKPNADAMQACILKSIKYPTGGYTEFEYEPHYYDGTSTVPFDISASSGAMNNTTDLLQHTVTFTTNRNGYAQVTAYCSNVVDAMPYFSTVTLKKVGGSSLVNHTYDPYTHGSYGPELSKDYWVLLSPGTYELKVTSKGTSQSTYYNSGAFSKATAFWEDFAPSGTPVMAGGLRVKETRDYEGPGTTPIIKVYKYGTSQSGKGILISPENKLSSFKEAKDTRFWKEGIAGFCTPVCTTNRLTIHGNTPHDLTTFNGSTVIYPEVTVFEKSTSAPNGRSVFQFSAVADEIYPASQGFKDGVILLDNSWKASDLNYSADYFGNTANKAREITNTNPVLVNAEIFGTKMGKKYVETGGCGPGYSAVDVYTAFYYFDYPIRTGFKKLTSTIERNFSTADPAKYTEVTSTFHYDNLNDNHQQLSRRITLDSEGNPLKTQYWYPADYGVIDNIPTLLSKNIINKPLKEETHRNTLLIAGKVNRLNGDGEIFEVYQHESAVPATAPEHSANTLVPPGYIRKIDVGYDVSTKNPNRVQAVDNVNTAYLWAYNNSYPVAKAVNAAIADIAATSFESDGKGNWTYLGQTYNNIAAKTGTYYYSLGGGDITKSLAPGKYKLEYWAKGTSITLSGGTITTIRTSPADGNGWILHEKEVVVSTTTTLRLSGISTTYIDEIRLYPLSAQMTSYTYDRLNGITSVNDTNNVIQYYEYDTSGRLKWLKDKDGNIVKSIEYRYKAK